TFNHRSIMRLTISGVSLNWMYGNRCFKGSHLLTELSEIRKQLRFGLSSLSHSAYTFLSTYGRRTNSSLMFLARGIDCLRVLKCHLQDDARGIEAWLYG